MVYMPADVLGWRPVVRSWLDQFLAARHAAAQGSSTDEAPKALSPEASQLASPATPGLPGFGKNSFAVRGAGSGNCSGQCPEGMLALRDCIWGMFERFAEPLLQWVFSKGSPMLQLSPATLMASVTALLEIQLDTLAR